MTVKRPRGTSPGRIRKLDQIRRAIAQGTLQIDSRRLAAALLRTEPLLALPATSRLPND